MVTLENIQKKKGWSVFKDYLLMLGLCLLMWANLFYMHYEVYISRYALKYISYPILFWTADVIITLAFFFLFTLGRRKVAYILTYVFLNFFVVANVIYSRFFDQYFTWSVLCEASNFQGTWWLQYVPLAFKWSDLFLVFSTGLFIIGLKYLDNKRTILDGVFLSCVIFVSCCIFTIIDTREAQYSLRSFEQMQKWVDERIDNDFDFGPGFLNGRSPNQEYNISHNGILKTQVYGNIVNDTSGKVLSSTEIDYITRYIENRNKKNILLSDSCIIKGSPNIVFILVESYMSVASKTTVQGIEITPNLNTLIRDNNNYSNLQVTTNKGLGVSSDAQVSYFTGLIPMKSETSILHIIKNEIVALPKLLREQQGYYTYITLPTGKFFWHQNEANLKYGIDNVVELGNEDNNYWCQDEELFEKVEDYTPQLNKPYLNIILTLSMHGAYENDFLEKTDFNAPCCYPDSFSTELCNYLNKCYYTDIQIGKYIQYLKDTNQYDNTVIIICSDHETKSHDIKDDGLSKDLPFIFVNTGISPDLFYQGRVNQIDLFPTMLDMFGLKSEWRGIGHSLLRSNYTDSITVEDRKISDLILLGDYFRFSPSTMN